MSSVTQELLYGNQLGMRTNIGPADGSLRNFSCDSLLTAEGNNLKVTKMSLVLLGCKAITVEKSNRRKGRPRASPRLCIRW